jgi:hypothetical protein
MPRRLALCLIVLVGCDDRGRGPGGDGIDAPILATDAGSGRVLAAMPGTIDFGTVALGATSALVTVTLVYEGEAAATASSAVSGPDATAFQITSTTCGALAAPSDNCTTTLRFAPMMVGPSAANLVFSAGAEAVSVTLNGVGTQQASLQVAPSVHDYGAVAIGSTAARTFTVTNATGLRTGALAVSIAGADASQFATSTDSCTGAMLNESATCTVVVAFSPTGTGAKGATLAIAGTPGGSVTASLLGTGAAAADSLVITPAMFDFGAVGQGNSSLAKLFTVTNIGTATTGVIATMMTGNHPGDFIKQGDQCNNHTLVPGGACTLFLTFEPGPTGLRTARVQASASPGGMGVAAVSGTGTP